MSSRENVSFRINTYLGPLLFIAVVLAISLFFPSESRFSYKYERHQTWEYKDLYAPFDFAIQKTRKEIAEEEARLAAQNVPVYEMDPSVVKQRKAAFVEACYMQLSQEAIKQQFNEAANNTQLYIRKGNELLDYIYQRGIIRLSNQHDALSADQRIIILRQNKAEDIILDNILNTISANKLVSDSIAQSEIKDQVFLLNLLQEQLTANLFYNVEQSNLFAQNNSQQPISPHHALVKQGTLIIAHDAIVTDEVYQTLVSLESAYQYETSGNWYTFSGFLLLSIFVIFIFNLYLRRFAPFVYKRNRKLIFILMWFVIYGYLVYLTEGIANLSPFIIPFCIVPIVVKTFFNEKLALFTHLSIVLIASFLTSLGYEFTFLQLLAGTVVILDKQDIRNSASFFTSLLFIFLTYSVGYLGLSLIKEATFESIDWSLYSVFFVNVFLTLLAYPLIPLIERIFGFVSSFKLVELSDMNQPLLRELAFKAPGTLQHSLQVGNLAEAAARKIGADPLLVKVGALYHDIGKTKHPQYYIENQTGEKSLHESKTAKESAAIIIAHVSEGAEMARKAGLPPVLINFILTHHGTTRTEYFYRNYIQSHPNEQVDEKDFQYTGPKPHTKEESILMLADSVEAACKSLKNPSQEELFAFIDKILNYKLSTGQLEESVLSFQDLESCRASFKQTLKSVYHLRMAYPEEEE